MEGNPVVVDAEAFVDASVAAFTAVLAGGGAVAGTPGSGTAAAGPGAGGCGGVEPGAGGIGDDPLQRVADNALDVLAGVARSEAATKDEPPGWISPTGRHYKSEHQDWEPPHWPESALSAMPARLGPEEHNNGQVRDVMPCPPMAAAQACPAGDAAYSEPPPEEPVDGNLIDPDDIPADDPLWEDFYALPPMLTQDPTGDWDPLRNWEPVLT
jgi:hypothetical protein